MIPTSAHHASAPSATPQPPHPFGTPRSEGRLRPLGRVCKRVGGCTIDTSDGWCSTCTAFVDEPKQTCHAAEANG